MSTEKEIQIAKSCPIYDELKESFHLKAPNCGNACKLKKADGELEILEVCPKTPEECSALADLKAEVEGSAAITTDEELQQEKLIREWAEKEGIDPTLLS